MKTESRARSIWWIDPKILTWTMYVSGGETVEESILKRSYENWKHADDLIAKAKSEFDRIDVITTLKRAVDARLRLLDQIYKFKTIPIPDKPKDLYGILSCFDIIRPLLLSTLYEIRRGVEHRDAEPPTQDRCKEFVEFVWYFLRSTDNLLLNISNHIEIVSDSSEYEHYCLTIIVREQGRWSFFLRGWLPSEFWSPTYREDWIELEAKELVEGKDFKERIRDNSLLSNWNDTDRKFAGPVIFSPEQLRQIFLTYFNQR